MKFKYVSRWLTAILLFMTIVSCQKEINTTTDNTTVSKTLLNVPYGPDAMQVMDVYLPAGRDRATTKVIILVHGGAWTSGDKSDFSSFIDSIKRRLPDYAIFNINYRLSAAPDNLFPTQEMDIKTATTFIIANTVEYQLSDKYVLLGFSAGGHLAMLQGFKYLSPVVPKAIVSFYGPSDLKEMYNNPVGGNFLISAALAQAIGKTPADDIQLYVNSSPINFITVASPPTILLHGGMDELVNPAQSAAVSDKLQSFGINNEYVFYPDAGHDVWADPILFDALNKVQAFLAANVL